MFPHTITIYNLIRGVRSTPDSFRRTVIEGVHWESEKGIQLGDTNIKSDNSISVVIPMTVEGFVLPGEYQKLTDRAGKWTLSEGDFIVKGSHALEITDVSDLKDFDMKMTIASYEVNDQAIMSYLNNYTANGK